MACCCCCCCCRGLPWLMACMQFSSCVGCPGALGAALRMVWGVIKMLLLLLLVLLLLLLSWELRAAAASCCVGRCWCLSLFCRLLCCICWSCSTWRSGDVGCCCSRQGLQL